MRPLLKATAQGLPKHELARACYRRRQRIPLIRKRSSLTPPSHACGFYGLMTIVRQWLQMEEDILQDARLGGNLSGLVSR